MDVGRSTDRASTDAKHGSLFDNKGQPCFLLKAIAVAQRLGVSPKTVYRWAKTGLIPCLVIGPRTVRFRPEDIDAIIAGKWDL